MDMSLEVVVGRLRLVLMAGVVSLVACDRVKLPSRVEIAPPKTMESQQTSQSGDAVPNDVVNSEKGVEGDKVAGVMPAAVGVWADWLDVGSCDSQTGTKRQARMCEAPDGLAVDGGFMCAGVNSQVVPCPIDGGWSLWVDDQVCVDGKKNSTRVCNNPEPKNGGAACVGDGTKIIVCGSQTQMPTGSPTQTQTQTGSPTQTQTQTGSPTPMPISVAGLWSSWRDTGSCNMSTGLQAQSRTCSLPAKSPAGTPFSCAGPSAQNVACKVAVNGGWSDWRPGACTSEGLMSLTRTCDKPWPSNGGAFCEGRYEDVVACTPATPVPQAVLVLVDSALVESLTPEITQFMKDLGPKAKRFDVNAARETTVAMKLRIREQHLQSPLSGVIAIGALPSAKLYNDCDFNGVSSTFNADLYFTDIDHVWSDANSDGKFESTGRALFQGNSGTTPYTSCKGVGLREGPGYHFPLTDPLKPKFWMSRIVFWDAPAKGTSKLHFYKQYFLKNHAFRTGLIANPKRGLNLVSKDWGNSNSFRFLYENAQETNHYFGADATKDNWLKEITTGNYEAAMPWVHSSASYHAFAGGQVKAASLYGLSLKPLFYNLWACSAGNYDAKYNTLSVAYLANGNTLAVTASSKTGSIQGYRMFYRIRAPLSLGGALNSELEISNWGGVAWAAGMSLLGDGSLKLR